MKSDRTLDVEQSVRRRLDSLTKPQGSLGRLEELALRYALIRGEVMPEIRARTMFIFCADHGVTEYGVSAYPSEVTRQMVANFLRGGAAVSVLCRQYGIEPVVVDMGVRGEPIPGTLNRKIACGTANFARQPAMTRTQAGQAIAAGVALAREAAGYAGVLAAGEMGIGNTTAAAALLSAFSGIDPSDTVGRGTGLDDEGVRRKTDVVREALALHSPDPADPIGVLAAVGGFEIGAIAGLILGAVEARVPVVLDGFISCSAALIARAMSPAALDGVLYSHCSAERGHGRMLEFLGARPYLSLDMRLGEGSGAALAIGLLESAVRLYREMATFEEAAVSEKL